MTRFAVLEIGIEIEKNTPYELLGLYENEPGDPVRHKSLADSITSVDAYSCHRFDVLGDLSLEEGGAQACTTQTAENDRKNASGVTSKGPEGSDGPQPSRTFSISAKTWYLVILDTDFPFGSCMTMLMSMPSILPLSPQYATCHA